MIQTQYFFKNMPDDISGTIKQRASKKINNIDKYFFAQNADLKIKVESTNNGYLISHDLSWKSHHVFIKETGHHLWKLINISFSNLKQNTLQELEQIKDFSRIKVSYQTLKIPVSQKDPKSFTQELEPLIPSLKKYIKRELKSLSLLLKTKFYFEIDEVLNQVIEKAYQNFNLINTDTDIKKWLEDIANLVINLNIKQSKLEKQIKVSWEKLKAKEIEKLNHRLTVDFEGNPQIAVPTKNGYALEDELTNKKHKLHPNLINVPNHLKK